MKFLAPHLPKNSMEKHTDSSEEISTDLLNENDTQQRNEDYIYAKAILKCPLFSAPEEFNDPKIGLKIMKKTSQIKL